MPCCRMYVVASCSARERPQAISQHDYVGLSGTLSFLSFFRHSRPCKQVEREARSRYFQQVTRLISKMRQARGGSIGGGSSRRLDGKPAPDSEFAIVVDAARQQARDAKVTESSFKSMQCRCFTEHKEARHVK